MDKSSTYPHFHISTATICRFVRTYITIFTNKIAQFQHMGEFTPQQLTKSLFSQIEFFKNAQKPHKNAVKTDCIYFDRFFWLLKSGSNGRPCG